MGLPSLGVAQYLVEVTRGRVVPVDSAETFLHLERGVGQELLQQFLQDLDLVFLAQIWGCGFMSLHIGSGHYNYQRV